MTGMDELVTWLRAQVDEDERWARAASQAYPYADNKRVPETGVHWTWVAGENWDPVQPEPAVDEFVAEPGYPCNLATVETWTSSIGGMAPRRMRRTYANEIVEMDASAAGHIARWDPARVLAEVDAKRRILDLTDFDVPSSGYDSACEKVFRLLALPYADRPGYREEWRL